MIEGQENKEAGEAVLADIITWVTGNETLLSGVAAVVVVLSIVGAAVRGTLKRTSSALVETARSTKEALARSRVPSVDVSQPAPGFGGRPAIAVLPFDNMSDDPDQDYFADGIAEDILTGLQSFRTFPVIARNSTFAYKGKSKDLREIAAELGAGYILEGSVRKSGDKVRITGQLIDAEGHHLWADRFDRDLADIFAVQDEITAKIIGAIAPEIESADARRVHAKPTENLDAWDCVLKAMSLIQDSSADSLVMANELLTKAVVLDPRFAQAYALLANVAVSDFTRHEGKVLSGGRKQALDNAAMHATKALSLERSSSTAHGMLAVAHLFRRQFELGLNEALEAVRLNPSDTTSRGILAFAEIVAGNPDVALEHIALGKRLSPGDPGVGRLLQFEAIILYSTGRLEEAELRAREAIDTRPGNPAPRYILIVVLDAQERAEEARIQYQELIGIAPESSPFFLLEVLAKQKEIGQQARDALQRAGWGG